MSTTTNEVDDFLKEAADLLAERLSTRYVWDHQHCDYSYDDHKFDFEWWDIEASKLVDRIDKYFRVSRERVV